MGKNKQTRITGSGSYQIFKYNRMIHRSRSDKAAMAYLEKRKDFQNNSEPFSISHKLKRKLR